MSSANYAIDPKNVGVIRVMGQVAIRRKMSVWPQSVLTAESHEVGRLREDSVRLKLLNEMERKLTLRSTVSKLALVEQPIEQRRIRGARTNS